MSHVFLYGTLRHPPLLQAVLGRAAEPVPARLPGHAVRAVEGETFPALHPDADAAADGLLVAVTEAETARLDYYLGPRGFTLAPVRVEAGQGTEQALAPIPEPGRHVLGGDWSFGDWARDWGPMSTLAAAEVMACQGREPADSVHRRYPMILARAQAHLRTTGWKRPRTVGRKISRDDVKIAGHSYDFVGFFTLETYDVRHPPLAGGDDLAIRRLVFRAGEAVTVLPYDPMRDRVLLVEQFRTAPFVQGDPDPWLLEPIAGIVDAGETPETAARREAEEEAGVRLHGLEFIARYYPTPGATAQLLHSYAALADLPDDLARFGGLTEEGEDIAVHLVSYDALVGMLESGELANAPAILSAQWLAVHRARLRASA
ncbi:NUDIX domain-containing protein [Rhodobacterales bacterium HKCCE2091]|nr:NUDIX domain-containing protein [Rhodobacterales bacterium HKCCE2091]